MGNGRCKSQHTSLRTSIICQNSQNTVNKYKRAKAMKGTSEGQGGGLETSWNMYETCEKCLEECQGPELDDTET